MVIKSTSWIAEKRLLLTELSGLVSTGEVQEWKQSLNEGFDKIPDGTAFRFMANLYGFKAMNIEAHKAFREVIPLQLARYGWWVGYLDMFPESDIQLTITRGIRCVAVAHVHQDETKMHHYQQNYSHAHEQYFTHPQRARNWIESLG